MSNEFMGFKILSEMSNEELITEILHDQKLELEKQERTLILDLAVKIRLKQITRRLYQEAGLSEPHPLFGFHIRESRDDEG